MRFNLMQVEIVPRRAPLPPIPNFKGSCPRPATSSVRKATAWLPLACLVLLVLGVNVARLHAQPTADPRLLGAWPGHLRGDARAVAVSGQHAFVAIRDGGLAVFNVADPSHPVRVGGFDTGGMAMNLQLQGTRLFVTSLFDNMLIALDVSDPAKVSRLGSYRTADWLEGIHIVDGLAYVAEGNSGLEILDVSDPAHMTSVGRYEDESEIWRVYTQGTTAYVLAYDGGAVMQTLDVSNPSQIRFLGKRDLPGTTWDIKVVGPVAFVASVDAGLEVFDVSNPATIARVGGFDTDGNAWRVQIAGNKAYVADSYHGVEILDVSDPRHITRLGGLDTPGFAEDVLVVGSLAYVADWVGGLQILEVSNPAANRLLGGAETDGYAHEVKIVDGRAYLADDFAGLQILDVSQPATISRLGGYGTIETFSGITLPSTANGLDVVGTTAYVAFAAPGLEILDVSDPTHVTRLGGFGSDSGVVMDVRVMGGHAYLATGSGGFQILDVSNPSQVVRLGGFPGYYTTVHVEGSLACLREGQILDFVDVSNPSNPTSRGQFYAGTDFIEVFSLVGSKVYFAQGTTTLKILDASLPGSAELLGSYETGAAIRSVRVAGTMAYVGVENVGLLILDVSNPAQIRPVGRWQTLRAPEGIHVESTKAYVAQGRAGLAIFDLTQTWTAQSITFAQPPGHAFAESPIPLNATASSGLPVSFQVVSGPAILTNDHDLILTGPGQVTVGANQYGDATFAPALQVTRSFDVTAPTLEETVASWIASKYPGVPAGQRSAASDPDADGAANALEFLFGTDPLVTEPQAGRLPIGKWNGQPDGSGSWSLSFRLGPDVPGYLWVLESSYALPFWSEVPPSWLQLSGRQVRFQDSYVSAAQPAATRFFRLRLR